jgi:hypothetical protein
MRKGMLVLLTMALGAVAPGTPVATAHDRARHQGAFEVDILVDGTPLTEYAARGKVYVEALEGREYAIRLRNPLGVRVAVALSVDGLNTIDARHTSATAARKWVLAPYETVVISGWQTGSGEARRFFFTTEARSYGQWLGKTENLGTISAVFFRERAPIEVTRAPRADEPVAAGAAPDASGARDAGPGRSGVAAPAPSTPAAAREKNEYAATGMGRAVEHRVEQVWLDLEPAAVAAVDLRYEFRPELVRLGVLPASPAPLTRRERGRGFDGPYAPVPPGVR